MEIILNGERQGFQGELTAAELLDSLGLRPGGVVLEINRRICPRDELGRTLIRQGEEVEIIRLVGGG